MQRSQDPTVSVVVPTRNEARNIQVVLPAIAAVRPAVHEVIVVDGNSVDGTVETARRVLPWVRIVQQTRKGKGNAMACGFAAATGDIVVMFDADGSADPAEIPKFVQALIDGADFAKGSRFARGGGSDDITLLRRSGNFGLNSVANARFKTRHSDLCYGYNAFWADLLPLLDLPPVDAPAPDDGSMLWGDGFEIETVLACRVAAADLRVTEVPSYERERMFGDTNLRTFADGTRVLRTLAAERRRASRKAEQEAAAPVAPAHAERPAPGYATTGHAVNGYVPAPPVPAYANGHATNGHATNGSNGHGTNGHAVHNGRNGHGHGYAPRTDTLPVPPTTEPVTAHFTAVDPAAPTDHVAPVAPAAVRPSPRPVGRPAERTDRPAPDIAGPQREALDARYALEEEAS
jgi:hypothetical protein